LRYVKPPDSLLRQLDAYTEDRYEDEEDLREQRLHTIGRHPNGQNARELDDPMAANFIRLAKAYPDAYPYLQQIVQAVSTLLEQETSP
jgi:diaphanous 1